MYNSQSSREHLCIQHSDVLEASIPANVLAHTARNEDYTRVQLLFIS
jgi:hypothetical protein